MYCPGRIKTGDHQTQGQICRSCKSFGAKCIFYGMCTRRLSETDNVADAKIVSNFKVSEECFSEPECEEVCTPVTARWVQIFLSVAFINQGKTASCHSKVLPDLSWVALTWILRHFSNFFIFSNCTVVEEEQCRTFEEMQCTSVLVSICFGKTW